MGGGERDEDALEAAAGSSLWGDAWRRLKKNKMAMVGLVITVIMTNVAVLADVLMPYDPRRDQLWTGALPPGIEILDLRNQMRFRVGQTPGEADVPGEAFARLGDGREHELTFTLVREEVSTITVAMYGDTIRKIRVLPREGGVKEVSELELAEGEYLRQKDRVWQLDVRSLEQGPKKVEARKLVVDEAAPPGLPTRSGSYVVSLERVFVRLRSTLVVGFDGAGAVTRIERDGVAEGAAAPVVVRPLDVRDVQFDGQRITRTHVLGTDKKGRDSLSRLIYGSRISLLIGITATLVSLLVGVIYGAFSGYVGGKLDGLLMRIVDVLYGIPYLFLVILLLVAFGRNIVILFVALGLVQWLTMARIVRGQVLSLREKEFIDAAITVGTRPMSILLRHLIPNTLGVVVVYTTLTVPAVILQESFLSFLGLTVELDGQAVDSWGALVNDGRLALGEKGENWWLIMWPSLAMCATLFSLNFLGDGLRDALDPQQRGRT